MKGGERSMMRFMRNQRGFGLLEVLVVVVVVVVVGYAAEKLGEEIGKATVSAGQAIVAQLQQRDRNAGISHVPVSPVVSPDGNHYIWTYTVAGYDASLDSVSVGPIHPDIATTSIGANAAGWTGARNGNNVLWRGPRLPRDSSVALTFNTTRDAIEGVGTMSADIYVDIIPATAGARKKSAVTHIPQKR